MTCLEAETYLLEVVGVSTKDIASIRKDACKGRLKIDLPTEVIEGLQKPYYGLDYQQRILEMTKKSWAKEGICFND